MRTGETEPSLLAALGCTLRRKALFAPHAGAGVVLARENLDVPRIEAVLERD